MWPNPCRTRKHSGSGRRPVRQRKGHIKRGSFAEVIRAYLASPKYDALAKSTRVSYGYLLGLAERPDTLGAYPVDVIRPALVQAFLDGLADRPAQQKNAQTALKAVEKWALVRDLLAHPITMGTEAPGGTGAYEPWTDEQVELAERCCRPHLARVITLASNTGQRGSDLVKMAWSDIEEYDGRPGINVTQKKTGLKIWIPFTQELIRAIATWERRPTFILLKDLDTTVVTWMNAMIWSSLRRGKVAGAIHGFGKLLASL